jgi:hypothetical protein
MDEADGVMDIDGGGGCTLNVENGAIDRLARQTGPGGNLSQEFEPSEEEFQESGTQMIYLYTNPTIAAGSLEGTS